MLAVFDVIYTLKAIVAITVKTVLNKSMVFFFFLGWGKATME
jgi:hypothetical protein